MSAGDPADGAEDAGALARLPSAADLAAFDRWFAKARYGDKVLLASGRVPPRSAASWVRAGELARGGLLVIHHLRCGAEGFNYVAVRVDGRGAAKTAVAPVDPEEPIGRMLRMLKRRANLGMHCPTNAEFNADLGIDNADYLFRQLVKSGAIASRDEGPGRRRIVTICASGLATKAGPL